MQIQTKNAAAARQRATKRKASLKAMMFASYWTRCLSELIACDVAVPASEPLSAKSAAELFRYCCVAKSKAVINVREDELPPSIVLVHAEVHIATHCKEQTA